MSEHFRDNKLPVDMSVFSFKLLNKPAFTAKPESATHSISYYNK